MGLNFFGLIAAAATLFVIGAMHPIVVVAEYYLSAKIWPIFLIVGGGACVGSVLVSNDMASTILGISGCVVLWSIVEIKQQERRVERGWFPKNPKRHYKSDELDKSEDEEYEDED